MMKEYKPYISSSVIGINTARENYSRNMEIKIEHTSENITEALSNFYSAIKKAGDAMRAFVEACNDINISEDDIIGRSDDE